MYGIDTIEAIVGDGAIAAASSGTELAVLELVTADADGWPHLAWLGPGELVVADETTVLWCLWEHSTTSRNLKVRGRALLHAVVAGTVAKWRCDVLALGGNQVGKQQLLAYRGVVVEAKIDAVTYAEVASGPTFRLSGPTSHVIERWEAQLAWLRELADGRTGW